MSPPPSLAIACRRLPPRRGASRPRRQRAVSTEAGHEDGYRSIGSFHSEDVEKLIRLPKRRYAPPALPFDTSAEGPASDGGGSSSPSTAPFANARRCHPCYSHLDREKWTFLNHGAFGLALDAGLYRAHRWRQFLEAQPLRYFDRHLLPHLVHGARGMVDFVTKNEADASRMREGTAMIPNVTAGMNAVIGGHARCGGRDGLVFCYDIGYGSTKKMCQIYHGKENAIAIPFEEEFLPLMQKTSTAASNKTGGDVDSEVFISALDAAIHETTQKREKLHDVAGSLLILDHITSNTAIHLPIDAIAKHAKEEHGMMVAVDGAHALLGLPLDIGSTLSTGNDPRGGGGHIDVYLMNAHKWFSSPRGAALLFCADPEIRDGVLSRPAVVSHGVDDGFLSRFIWDGCRDYAAQLSLPAVLDHWAAAGVDTVRAEMRRNLREGVRILLSHWHPAVCSDRGDRADASCVEEHSAEAGLTLAPLEMHAPQMALVRLPTRISGGETRTLSEQRTSRDAKRVQDFLYSHYVEVPIKCIRGVLYARVSCHVYNTAEEFERLALVALKY